MKASILFLSLLVVTKISFAQIPEKFQFGFYGNVGFPTEEFRESVSNSLGGTGWGLGMNVFLNPKKAGYYSPVLIGIEGNFMNLGRDKTPATPFLPQLKTSFNYFNIGPTIRVLLSDREKGFVPFLDGFVGMKVLNTNTKIDNSLFDTVLNEEYLESLLSTNYEGFGYGIGVGFYKRKIKLETYDGRAGFFMKLMYQYGDRVNYVKRGSVKVDSDGLITYETGRTQTSFLLLQFGFLFH